MDNYSQKSGGIVKRAKFRVAVAGFLLGMVGIGLCWAAVDGRHFLGDAFYRLLVPSIIAIIAGFGILCYTVIRWS